MDKLGELLVDKVGQITTIIQDHVQGLAVREDDGLLDAPHILLVGFSLPGVDGHASGSNSSSGMILRAEDVAAGPLDLSSSTTNKCNTHRTCTLNNHKLKGT